jgi:hypothetical protein
MIESHAGPRPWAELRLLRGDGPSQVPFHADEPICLSVGSDPHAGLRIEARGVAPVHFTLVWDGVHLWLEDALRLGCTRVNGSTLNEWRCVQGGAVATFGAALLAMRGEGPAPTRRAPNFDALERGRIAESGQLRRRDTMRIRLPSR